MSLTEEAQDIDHGIHDDFGVQWTTPLVTRRNVIPTKRKCGHCGTIGHNKRTCPQLQQTRELIVVVTATFYNYT